MGYSPAPAPTDTKGLNEYVYREFSKIGDALKDSSESVLYRTLAVNQGSLSTGISANWKIAFGNVIRISTSNTITLTGLAIKTPLREVVLLNVGTGVIAMKSQGTESSASLRFALASNYQISADAAITLWRDPYSARWRCLSRT